MTDIGRHSGRHRFFVTELSDNLKWGKKWFRCVLNQGPAEKKYRCTTDGLKYGYCLKLSITRFQSIYICNIYNINRSLLLFSFYHRLIRRMFALSTERRVQVRAAAGGGFTAALPWRSPATRSTYSAVREDVERSRQEQR